MKTLIFYSIVFFLFLDYPAQANTYYVKSGGTGTGTTSWANAAGPAQLAAIIAAAASGDQVWVAQGTYYPTTGTARASAFILKSGVAVYGGFAGTETTLTARNWVTNVTILSGDIGTTGNSSDNVYHVVVSAGNTGTTVLDGFTISGGNANGTGSDTYNGIPLAENLGAGIQCYQTVVTITNCIVSTNAAASNGGGLYAYSTTVGFTGCTFSGNSSLAEGGGMMINANGGGGYTLTSCSFTNNTAAGSGGGLARDNGNIAVTITGCSFTSNSSTSTASQTGGGGIYLVNGGLTMTGCTISGNTASAMGGGLLYNSGSNSPITNTVFNSNTATVYGGGMAVVNSSPVMDGCNFMKNLAVEGGGLYTTSAGSPPSMTADTFSQNKATSTGPAGGGAFFANNSNLTLVHSLFLNNVSSGDGAGQYDSLSNVIDSEDVYNGNVASGNGGGIVYNGNNPKIYNCVLTDNVSTGYGGGMYIFNSNGTVMSSTIYNNSSASSTSSTPYGDGVYYLSGNVKFYSNIIWSRGNSASVGLVAAGTGESLDYNDIQNNATLLSTYGAYASNHNISSIPVFGNSGNYTGADGMWGTTDDGLHQATSSPAADIEPSNASGNGQITAYDITMTARPIPGNTLASMGAYEGPGGFITLLENQVGLTAAFVGTNSVGLSWQADGSMPASDYVLERAVNGGAFGSIATIDALAGQDLYRFTDAGVPEGVITYRIRAVWQDGSVSYSAVVSVMEAQAGISASLRPSVISQGAVNVYVVAPRAMTVNLLVVDVTGRVLAHRVASVVAGTQTISLDGVPGVPGLYYLRLSGSDGFLQTLAFEKM